MVTRAPLEAGRARGWLGVLGASRVAGPARGRRPRPRLPARRRRGAPSTLTWREPGQRPDVPARSLRRPAEVDRLDARLAVGARVEPKRSHRGLPSVAAESTGC